MITQATGDKRLLKLAEFLRTVPRKQFDYAQWVGGDWQGDPNLSCGTTACALGWATVMPMFRRLGLKLVKSDPRWPGNVELVDTTTGTSMWNLQAAMTLFDLEYNEAQFLFEPGMSYRLDRPQSTATPKQVARHIERFVAQRAVAKRAA